MDNYDQMVKRSVAERAMKITKENHKNSIMKIVYAAFATWIIQFMIGSYFIGSAVEKTNITYETTQLHELQIRENLVNASRNSQTVAQMQKLLLEYVESDNKQRDQLWEQIKKTQCIIEDELFGGKDIFRGNEVSSDKYFRAFDRSGKD